MKNSFMLITNGNLFTTIALGEWLTRFGHLARKICITRKLPSSKGNIRGVTRMYAKSGFDYTYFKVWVNKLLPIKLRIRGLPETQVRQVKKTLLQALDT